ncbi:MAG TPA: DNA alkylation repair protein [Candidatus Gracilibacteria bacterium]|nr:DNA alkylation repair protein [Candidatus Gracilibacteria bacterium]
MSLPKIKKDLQQLANPVRAKHSLRFFRTGKGEYGEGDKFLGITVPDQRKVAKKYFKELSLTEVEKLLQSGYHEHRLTALFMLVYKFERAEESEQKSIYDFYMRSTRYVNNWDLVDSSAHKIVGAWLKDKGREPLYVFAQSKDLWKKRIAMIATFAFIAEKDFEDALAIAEILVNDSHDLIHKAVGWTLREIGKKDQSAEEQFLKKYYRTMPRTMLRYAIERFDAKKKDFYMGRT